MKKTNIIIIVISSVLALAVIAGALLIVNSDSFADRKSQKDITTTQVKTQDETEAKDELSMEELEAIVVNIMEATDAEAVKQYLTDDSFDNAQGLVDFYTGTKYDVELQYATKYKNYIICSYSSKALEGADQTEDGYLLFTKDGDGYKLCVSQAAGNEINEHFACSGCGGSGTISTGATSTCGICSGTGQQYIPNLYYDAVLGWQGGYTGCGGCGGAGHTGAVSSTCPSCNGQGIVID